VREAAGSFLNAEVRYRRFVPAVGPRQHKLTLRLAVKRIVLVIPVVAPAHGWQLPAPAGLQGVVSFALPHPLCRVCASALLHSLETSLLLPAAAAQSF